MCALCQAFGAAPLPSADGALLESLRSCAASSCCGSLASRIALLPRCLPACSACPACLQDRFGFEWNQRGQHPTVEAWAEAVRDDWTKFMHKVGRQLSLFCRPVAQTNQEHAGWLPLWVHVRWPHAAAAAHCSSDCTLALCTRGCSCRHVKPAA